MGRGQVGAVVHQFQRLFGGGTVAGLTEWELLHRYLDRGDEDAFRAIVARHGPMVMAVARRVLGEARDVEDAFQVTFLILAKKARSLGEGDPVGHWLYGVAYRVAMRARTATIRRRSRERTGPAPEPSAIDDPSRDELGGVIDEELARLPAKYRAPIVLCYLEGLTHEEAARELGWPVGTVKGRLARGRDLLKGRLSRRGMAPAGVMAMVGLIDKPGASVPASIVERTSRAAVEFAAGRATGMVSASAAALLEGEIGIMFLTKLKLCLASLLVLGAGTAVLAYQGSKEVDGTATADPVGHQEVKKAEVVRPPRPVEGLGPIANWPILDDSDPVTKAILGELDTPIAMHFPSDTPLEDVKKYIQEATKGPGLPNGIPIYIDPQGLQDADKTMASTVQIELEGRPLKQTLRLLLKQLGLSYLVKDGLLTVTSVDSVEERSPFVILREKGERGELTKEQYKELIEVLKLRNEIRKLNSAVAPTPQNQGGFR